MHSKRFCGEPQGYPMCKEINHAKKENRIKKNLEWEEKKKKLEVQKV